MSAPTRGTPLTEVIRRATPTLALVAAAVLAVSVVADIAMPPARANLPSTLYVDRRIGADHHDGRTPETPLATLEEAVRRAEPGTTILITGYGHRLVYPGTGTKCLTVRGTPDRPVVIRRNVYTNTLNPTVFTTNRRVPGPWRLVEEESDGRQTWSTPWPNHIRLFGDPDLGLVRVGGIAMTGYPRRPPDTAEEASWWEHGTLFIRTRRANPNNYPVFVKDGDGICLSGRSRHVRIKDIKVAGAVHAVRAEPGAVDIRVQHVVRENVLDADRLPGAGEGEGRR
ncbi:hypothetical protein [Thermasporomyces composti]|jgi:hypothetical protein|uniref:DUF1565 domain-containing protein n=1 Tax=Thermasporomyces composti TaxID=696763 RepID=A0A3D9V4W8_THECX|nr:hypothetical protein [Thermasporomyces composti]REF36557.1 hypothetical protein DFJ64_1970 [Thermasporomyces composti]